MIAAVIPLKALPDAKSRLAASLSTAGRVRLMVQLLEHVVVAVQSSGVADLTALVTVERDLARRLDTQWLPDAGDLNGSLRRAATWATARGARGLLILPADLPFLDSADVRAIVDGTGPRLTLAPAHDGGTNALFVEPPLAVAPHFGARSAARHLSLARQAGLPTHLVHRPGLTHDVDTPDDLDRLAVDSRWAAFCSTP